MSSDPCVAASPLHPSEVGVLQFNRSPTPSSSTPSSDLGVFQQSESSRTSAPSADASVSSV